jgi:hypothetical protein
MVECPLLQISQGCFGLGHDIYLKGSRARARFARLSLRVLFDRKREKVMTTKNDRTKKTCVNRRNLLLGSSTLAAASALGDGLAVRVAQAQQQPAAAPSGSKPNILFIMGDDIGWFNVSAYNMGVMGYRTPNIDRIGREGAVFTDWYGQQAAPPGARPSSPARRRSAPASPRSVCPAPNSVSARSIRASPMC